MKIHPTHAQEKQNWESEQRMPDGRAEHRQGWQRRQKSQWQMTRRDTQTVWGDQTVKPLQTEQACGAASGN